MLISYQKLCTVHIIGCIVYTVYVYIVCIVYNITKYLLTEIWQLVYEKRKKSSSPVPVAMETNVTCCEINVTCCGLSILFKQC